MKRVVLYTFPLVLVGFAAWSCGSTPPPKSPDDETAMTTPEPDIPEEPAKPPEKKTEPEEPEKLEPSSGRPLAIYNNTAAPTTVGLDGASFKWTSGAELRIPGGAFQSARNVIFTTATKSKGTKGKIGQVFLIQTQVPGSKFALGDARPSQAVESAGGPFLLKLPLPKGKESANLAIESVKVEEGKGGRKKASSSWEVQTMTKLETADTGNRAVFELKILPGAHVHLTSADSI